MDATSRPSAAALLVLILAAITALALYAFGEDTKEVRGAALGGVEGTAYTGYLVNGLASGAGMLEFDDGSAYYGMFAEGRFNGKGVYIAADGSTLDGTFEDGQLSE